MGFKEQAGIKFFTSDKKVYPEWTLEETKYYQHKRILNGNENTEIISLEKGKKRIKFSFVRNTII